MNILERILRRVFPESWREHDKRMEEIRTRTQASLDRTVQLDAEIALMDTLREMLVSGEISGQQALEWLKND